MEKARGGKIQPPMLLFLVPSELVMGGGVGRERRRGGKRGQSETQNRESGGTECGEDGEGEGERKETEKG